jgi:hypothetical protein
VLTDGAAKIKKQKAALTLTGAASVRIHSLMIELIFGGFAEGYDDPSNHGIEQSASKQQQQEKCQDFFVDCLRPPVLVNCPHTANIS